MQVKTFTVGASAGTFGLDAQYDHTLIHKGIDSSLATTTEPVFLVLDTSLTADGGDGDGKYILMPGEALTIGPGINIFKAVTNSGTVKLTVASSVLKQKGL